MFSPSESPGNTEPPAEIPAYAKVTHLEGVKLGRKPVVTGGSADIFRGMHPRFGEVALKRVRPPPGSQGDDLTQSEIAAWSTLNHPNVLLFLGVFIRGSKCYLVSPWADYGTLPHYLRECDPSANRIKFLIEAAAALMYLHRSAFVHGDVKGNNFLVSSSRHALLCDFGLSRHESTFTVGTTRVSGSTRWMSPELFKGVPKSLKSDVYAFGITISEILSGNVPYHHLKEDGPVISTVISGGRPSMRPKVSASGVSYSRMWDLASRCWGGDPDLRPSMREVYQVLCRDPVEPQSRPDDPSVPPPPDIPEHDAAAVLSSTISRSGRPIHLTQHPSLPVFNRFCRWVLEYTSLLTRRFKSRPTGAINILADRLVHSKINFDDNCPIASGGYGQVYRGTHRIFGAVALKRLQVNNPTPQDLAVFESEVNTWKVLDHPNILPFIGTFVQHGGIYLISPWAENGALPQYLKRHPDANRPDYIIQIADALTYLHVRGYIHGDINAQNVLVGSDRRALLSDFGLSKAVSMLPLSVVRGSSSLPWRSPELWDGKARTIQSDVYAFGMTIYEVLSGNIPYHDIETDAALAVAIVHHNRRPSRAPLVDPRNEASYTPVWEIAEGCWKKDPDERLTMTAALDRLRSTQATYGHVRSST